MNEPIAHYFQNKDTLYTLLQPLYRRCVKAIREVDNNHIILLGGAHRNSFFWMFDDWKFDSKLMYTCHRYGGEPTKEAINEWQTNFVRVLKEVNIGYTFWPYKKVVSTGLQVDGSCMMGIQRPEGWDSIVVKYSETSRNTYQEWREARPDQATFRRLLREFAENSRFERCQPQTGYIKTMGLGSK